MSRPVYYFDPDVTYTVLREGRTGPWFIEFFAVPQLMGFLRKSRCLMSTGVSTFSIQRVTRKPGPLVDGKHPLRVEVTKLVT